MYMYWSMTTVAAQLAKPSVRINEVMTSLMFSLITDIHRQIGNVHKHIQDMLAESREISNRAGVKFSRTTSFLLK